MRPDLVKVLARRNRRTIAPPLWYNAFTLLLLQAVLGVYLGNADDVRRLVEHRSVVVDVLHLDAHYAPRSSANRRLTRAYPC